MPPDPVHEDRLRRICLALPEATEVEAWEAPTFRVKGKIFAMFAPAGDAHDARRPAVWCKAPLGVQEMLVRLDAEKYFAPPYVGPKGWIGAMLAAVEDDELYELVVQSYCLTAPRRLQALLEQ